MQIANQKNKRALLTRLYYYIYYIFFPLVVVFSNRREKRLNESISGRKETKQCGFHVMEIFPRVDPARVPLWRSSPVHFLPSALQTLSCVRITRNESPRKIKKPFFFPPTSSGRWGISKDSMMTFLFYLSWLCLFSNLFRMGVVFRHDNAKFNNENK